MPVIISQLKVLMATQITCFYDVRMLFLETSMIFSELPSCPFYMSLTLYLMNLSQFHYVQLSC
jgi:hypothetical protein